MAIENTLFSIASPKASVNGAVLEQTVEMERTSDRQFFLPHKTRRRDIMTQEFFPEIQAATQALEKQIALTETEITQMKETMAGKKRLVRGWRKAIAAVSPRAAAPKKKAEVK
jgi:hypothetical protein